MSTCRICACTDEDCTWCMVLTGEACYWAEPDLCSACAGLGRDDENRAKKRGRVAWDMGHRRGNAIPGKTELLGHCDQMLKVYARHFCRRVRGQGSVAAPSPSTPSGTPNGQGGHR